MTVIHEDKLLESISYTNGISKETFDQCTFSKCDFSNARVTGCSFTDCIFTDCNFSMTDLLQTTLNNTEFSNCKMLGVKFNHCHDFIFQVDFDKCILDYSSFERRKMVKTHFKDSSLKGVDFAGADLKQSKFINCDLNEAIFYNSNIQEVNFASAFNYIIDLSQNQIKKARFSKDGLAGLLSQFDIVIE